MSTRGPGCVTFFHVGTVNNMCLGEIWVLHVMNVTCGTTRVVLTCQPVNITACPRFLLIGFAVNVTPKTTQVIRITPTSSMCLTHDTLSSIIDDSVFSLSHSLTVARPIPQSDQTNYRLFQFVHPCPAVHPRPSRPVLGRPKHHRLCQAV